MFERPPRPGEPSRPGGNRPSGPPRPPGSRPPRPPGSGGSRPPGPPRSRRRPGAPAPGTQVSSVPGIILAAAAIVTLGLFLFESSLSNAVGFLVGSLLGPVMLGWFLADDNARRAAGRYGDWARLPVRRLSSVVCALGWLLGGVHFYFLAQELTR